MFIIDYGSYKDDSGVWYHEQIGPFTTEQDAIDWGSQYYTGSIFRSGMVPLASGDYPNAGRCWTVLELTDPMKPRQPMWVDGTWPDEDSEAAPVTWNGTAFV